MMQKAKMTLEEVKARLTQRRKAYRRKHSLRSPAIRYGSKTPYCRVGDSLWHRGQSTGGVHYARFRIEDWEIHLFRIMRKVNKGQWEHYYTGMAVNNVSDEVLRKTYTCDHRTSEAKALNEMFGYQRFGVLFKI